MGCGSSSHTSTVEELNPGEVGEVSSGDAIKGEGVDQVQNDVVLSDVDNGGIDMMPGGVSTQGQLDKAPLPPIKKSSNVDANSVVSYESVDSFSNYQRPQTGVPGVKSPRKLPKLISGHLVNQPMVTAPLLEMEEDLLMQDKATSTMEGEHTDVADVQTEKEVEGEENAEEQREEDGENTEEQIDRETEENSEGPKDEQMENGEKIDEQTEDGKKENTEEQTENEGEKESVTEEQTEKEEENIGKTEEQIEKEEESIGETEDQTEKEEENIGETEEQTEKEEETQEMIEEKTEKEEEALGMTEEQMENEEETEGMAGEQTEREEENIAETEEQTDSEAKTENPVDGQAEKEEKTEGMSEGQTDTTEETDNETKGENPSQIENSPETIVALGEDDPQEVDGVEAAEPMPEAEPVEEDKVDDNTNEPNDNGELPAVVVEEDSAELQTETGNAADGVDEEDDDDDVVQTPAPSRPTSSSVRRTEILDQDKRSNSRLSLSAQVPSRPNTGSVASAGEQGDDESEVDLSAHGRPRRKKLNPSHRVRIVDGHELMRTPSPLANDSGAELNDEADGQHVREDATMEDKNGDESGLDNQESDYDQDIPITNLSGYQQSNSSVQVNG